MKLIKTLDELISSQGEDFVFKPMAISMRKVKVYGVITGDIYSHNLRKTKLYPEPIVQGNLAQSLFTGLHKKICRINGTEPVRMKVTQNIYLRPIYVGKKFIPYLKLESAEKEIGHIVAIWTYGLLSSEKSSKPLAKYTFEWWYRFKS